MMDLNKILSQFTNEYAEFEIKKFGNGLIHSTFIVIKNNTPFYILQKLNTSVFKYPEIISSNLSLLSSFLKSKEESLFFPLTEKALDGADYVIEDGIYYRLTKFVPGAHSIDSCSNADNAYEAALQFGKFTSAFKDFDANLLQPSIPQFHDLGFRWKQFQDALKNGNEDRIKFAQAEIGKIINDFKIVEKYNSITNSSLFFKRVTHHDTKINNVLFNEASKGICVIDLDTVMSGYFISDLGDMFRTYLSPASEEETDFNKIAVRPQYYQALVEGYLENMKDQMTVEELGHIKYAGEFMIYMQALRFLTDFLNNDIYYGIQYEMNNFNRTINQLILLDEFRKIS